MDRDALTNKGQNRWRITWVYLKILSADTTVCIEAVEKMGGGGKGWGRAMEGGELTKVKYTHSRDTSRNLFERWLRN
jgi:hypothetical protein